MEQENAHSVLERLLRSAGQAAVSAAVTPTRALRLAMARAAEHAVGLNLSVLGVTEEVMPLDEVLAALAPEMMLLALGRDGAPIGLAAFDLQLRTATVEMQTVGTLRQDPAGERKITDADAALCAPLVTGFLADLSQTAEDTSLEGWADGVEAGVRIADARAAGMMLEDCIMRLVRLSLDFATGERQGELLVALATSPKAHPAKAASKPPEFSEALRASVMLAPAELHAVLHRFHLSLREVEGFEVGQILPLHGVTVGSVQLEGPDGGCVGQARLGQVTGLRAVRVEQTAGIEMRETELGRHLEDAVAAAADLGGGMDMMGEGAALPGPMDMDGPAGMDPMMDAGDGGDDPADVAPLAGEGFDAAPMADMADMAGMAELPDVAGAEAEAEVAEDFGFDGSGGFDAAPMMTGDPEEVDPG